LRQYIYKDERITHKNRLYYLRTKYGRRGSVCVLSIRTHQNGKGRKLAEVRGVLKDDKSQIMLIHRLNRKMKFKYLIEVDIPTIPE
jgi:hypothetical protein